MENSVTHRQVDLWNRHRFYLALFSALAPKDRKHIPVLSLLKLITFR